jgi:hypothetical protein
MVLHLKIDESWPDTGFFVQTLLRIYDLHHKYPIDMEMS